MNKIKLSIALLSIVASMYPMEEHQQGVVEFIQPKRSKNYHAPMEELKMVYAQSPQEVKELVEHLKDPNYWCNPAARASILYGPPGTGKSTLAKAIAQQAGWELHFFTPDNIIAKDRNATGERLGSLLNDVVNKREAGSLVVLDEMNRLLENYSDSKYDTADTASVLWTFLDRQEGNHSFYLIGTMNTIDKLPPQIVSRFYSSFIEITTPTDINLRKDIFLYKLLQGNAEPPAKKVIELDKMATEYLPTVLKATSSLSQRDLLELAFSVKKITRAATEKGKMMIVSKKHLEQAKDKLDAITKKTKYGEKPVSDEERRHKEIVNQHEKHFIQNIMLTDSYSTRSQREKEVEEVLTSDQKLIKKLLKLS